MLIMSVLGLLGLIAGAGIVNVANSPPLGQFGTVLALYGILSLAAVAALLIVNSLARTPVLN